LYHWREHTLMAVRYGPWKAHYVTRSGFKPDPPVKHNPPLLFHVEHDPGEKYPIDPSTQVEVLAIIQTAYEQHLAQVVPGPPEYNFGLDPSLAPCCHGAYNATVEMEYIADHDWSLALWEKIGCICNPNVNF